MFGVVVTFVSVKTIDVGLSSSVDINLKFTFNAGAQCNCREKTKTNLYGKINEPLYLKI